MPNQGNYSTFCVRALALLAVCIDSKLYQAGKEALTKSSIAPCTIALNDASAQAPTCARLAQAPFDRGTPQRS